MQKEENLDLIKKLASGKIDTSQLRASTSLGVKSLPEREALKHPVGENGDDARVEYHRGLPLGDSGSESNSSNTSTEFASNRSNYPVEFETPKVSTFGSGLKRPAEDGNNTRLVIKKRRRNTKFTPPLQEELPWGGFSSADEPEKPASSHGTTTDEGEDDEDDSDKSDSSDFSEEESSDSEDNANARKTKNERSSAFKLWATQQVNEVMDFSPSTNTLNAIDGLAKIDKSSFTPRPTEIDPLPPELSVPLNGPERKAFSVQVERTAEIQAARLGLPVVAEEQKIMEAIYSHAVVVIWGATGSGKTTQVPQFLYEAGFGSKDGPYPGMIGITQPRRVAAVSMARRVGEELGSAQDKVSYQIRFDSSVSDKTAIKFMTDGILIREISQDFSLSRYSVIIIDEAHERSANTDILIGMVSRIVNLRETMSEESSKVRPLKLIIMSATLRISDFLSNPVLFRNGQPPLIQAEGRQYPVTTHFTRRTQRDYVEEAFRKVCRGHKKLPSGGILVFLTGQNEITSLSRKLKDALSNVGTEGYGNQTVRITSKDAPLEIEDVDLERGRNERNELDDLVDEDDDPLSDEDDQDFEIENATPSNAQVHILPLYSQLQTKDQLRVFQPPPENTRLIVLATNVAETSLTIPGIRYVFDCGRAKAKAYDQNTGVQSFEVGWISKASAEQRAGRAGRTGPGHCYRLYSSAIYERDFEDYTEPEILRMPVEGIVLQLKSMDLQNIVNFPFPSPPDRQSLAKAEKLLSYLGAISNESKLTPLGQDLSLYPLSPRFAKILSIGHQHQCMPYTIALVAALATPNILIPENNLDLSVPARTEDQVYTTQDRLADDARMKRKSAYNHAHHLLSTHSPTSDALKVLTALCSHAHASDKAAFGAEMFLSPKALAEAHSLYGQLCSIVHTTHPSLLPSPARVSLTNLSSPTKTQLAALQQYVAAGFIDQIAILASEIPNALVDSGRKSSRAIDVPYLPLFPITNNKRAEPDISDVAIYIHPSSLLAHRTVKELPTYVVYHHLQRAAPSTIGDLNLIKKKKTRMFPLVAVTGRQLAALARGTALLEYSKPVGKIEETEGGKKRVCWVVPNLVGEKKGGTGWPLPAVKAVQTKGTGGSGWEVESVIG